jgi:multidrug transporter EmrE-like cation transporter
MFHMAWFVLVVAGLLEVVWSLALKHTQGFK